MGQNVSFFRSEYGYFGLTLKILGRVGTPRSPLQIIVECQLLSAALATLWGELCGFGD